MSNAAANPPPIRFSLRSILAAMALIAMLLAGAISFSKSARDRRIDDELQNALKHVGLALENYVSSHSTWPAATFVDGNGQPLSSWRFPLTAFMECDLGGFAFYDKPWNGKENAQLVSVPFHLFRIDSEPEGTTTVIFGVTGPGTAFDPAFSAESDHFQADVVVAMEIADSKTHWMQPGDYNVTDLLAYNGRIGDHLHGLLPDRLHVLFADGEVWALSPEAPMTALHPFLTITGAKSNDRDQLLAAHRIDGPE